MKSLPLVNHHENLFIGPFAKDYFGVSTNFNRTLTRDFSTL